MLKKMFSFPLFCFYRTSQVAFWECRGLPWASSGDVGVGAIWTIEQFDAQLTMTFFKMIIVRNAHTMPGFSL